MRAPGPVLRRLAGGPRQPVEGQALDAGVELVIALAAISGGLDYADKTPARARFELEASARVFTGRPRRLQRVDDHVVGGSAGGIPVRVYVPRGLARPAPLLLYFHGGGWVVGSIDSHDGQCRMLADEAGCIVVSVGYRLAPEHRFPAAVDDAVDAWRWVLSNAGRLGADAARLAVGGDSAGGNLAAVLCQQVRALGLAMPAFQLLVYPATDLRRATASYQSFRAGYLLEAPTMAWFIAHYLERADECTDPRASPLLADDLTGLPRACVVTAGFDPLRDEGRAYAERLRQARVPVTDVCHPELIHGFMGMAGALPAARRAALETARALAAGLATAT